MGHPFDLDCSRRVDVRCVSWIAWRIEVLPFSRRDAIIGDIVIEQVTVKNQLQNCKFIRNNTLAIPLFAY